MQSVNHTARRRNGSSSGFKSARRRPAPQPAAPQGGPITVRGLAKRLHTRGGNPSGTGGGNRTEPAARRSLQVQTTAEANLDSVRKEMNERLTAAIKDLTDRVDRVHQVIARCVADATVFEDEEADRAVSTIQPGQTVLLSTRQVKSNDTILAHMYFSDPGTGQQTSRYVVVFDDAVGHRFEFLNNLP